MAKNKEKEASKQEAPKEEKELPKEQAADDIKEAEQAEKPVDETAQEAEEKPDALAESQKKCEELAKQIEELNDKILRQYAEFDNYKKRTAREKDAMYDYATGQTILKIFPVLDVFEQALKTQTEDEAFYKGVAMIYERFLKILTELGVKETPGVGEAFDPNLHNAVSRCESEEFGENTVCQVYQTGYMLKDKVLRPAMVVVANP